MDLSNKIFICTDKMLQQFMVECDSNGLIAFAEQYLDENALRDILENMSFKAEDMLLADMQAYREGRTEYEGKLDQIIKSNPNITSTGCILFTDLVNSTEKINLLGDDNFYEHVLIKHNSILQECINKNRGRIIKNIGDAYLAIFRDDFNALKCCITAQNKFKELNQERESDDQIIVRMAVHYGEYSKKIMENGNVDVYGTSVNYAARIVSYTGGGQICVSKKLINSWDSWDLNGSLYKRRDIMDSNIKSWKERIEKYDDEMHYYTLNDVEQFYKDSKLDKELYENIFFSSIGFFNFKGFDGEQELFSVNVK